MDGRSDMVVEFAIASRACVGLVFVLAAMSKVRNPAAWRQFQDSTARLAGDSRRRYTGWLSRAVVAAELAIPVLVLGSATAVAGLALAGGLTIAFTTAALLARARGTAACACFGSRTEAPWWSTVLRNSFIVVAAALGVSGTLATISPTISPTTGLALAAGFAAALLIVGLDYAFPTQERLV